MSDPRAYRDWWLAALRAQARRAEEAPAPELPTSVWFAPALYEPRTSLADLFANGVRCGHVATREVLASRVGEADAERDSLLASLRLLEEAQAQTQEALAAERKRLAATEADLRRARERIREIETSTTWRMTLPVRSTMHRVKRGVRGVRHTLRVARYARPRLTNAWVIAREQGVRELARRVRRKLWPPRRVPGLVQPRRGVAERIGPLHVPPADNPRISVIVPTYGQHLYTFSCLAAIAQEAAGVPLEVIVIDDAYAEPAAEALATVTGVRFERNAENLGFLRTCNRAATFARGDYLLLLNNDAILEPGALRALLALFEREPAAGAVGAKLIYPDGRLQEAGGIVWRDGSAWNDGRGDDPRKPEYNYVREADYCSAACLMVPRALWTALGGFDEAYVPAYYEDTDLCMRIRASGRKVLYQPEAVAVHHEGVSHGTDLASGLKRHQVENARRFHERWRDALASHRPNGAMPRLERDRGAARRVLFVEACMLTPDQDSGSLRTWTLLEIMRAMGCKVTFVADNLEDREPYTARLQQAGVEVLHAPWVRSVAKILEERGRDFDVVILARYYVAGRHVESVRRLAPQALLVLDTVDLHFLRQRRLAQLEGTAVLARNAERVFRQEMECILAADVTWVVSEAEREVLAREAPAARVMVQSNVHRVHGAGHGFAERQGLLFVGGFRHPPNVDAIAWYVREILPHVRERLPGVKTYVIGSSAPAAVLELQAEDVEVLGYVPVIEPWLDRCRLSVSPLRYGAGVKGKVNQAMSHGLPVVATTASIEGMNLVPGEQVLVADEPLPFAEAVARAYRDEALWNRLSAGGLANVAGHFSPEVARRGLEALFRIADGRRAAASRGGE